MISYRKGRRIAHILVDLAVELGWVEEQVCEPADEDSKAAVAMDGNGEEPPKPARGRPKTPAKAAIEKAKDLAGKAATAATAGAPAAPAAPGESVATETPAPDTRMVRPACERHGAAMDAAKYRVLVVTSDRCQACLAEKESKGQTPATVAGDISPERVRDTLIKVMAKYGDAKGYEILKTYGAETVAHPDHKQLDPVHYQAVLDACSNLLNPPATAAGSLL
jgi:hypothetical protein